MCGYVGCYLGCYMCCCRWFHGYLDRPDAEYLLSKHEAGAYIVRISIPSLDQPTKYILSVRTSYGYQHFK